MTFHSVGNFIIPIDFHIFQRGRYTTNQVTIGIYETLSWDYGKNHVPIGAGFRNHPQYEKWIYHLVI